MSRKNIGTNYVHKLWIERYMNKFYNARTKVMSITYEKKYKQNHMKITYEQILWKEI